MLCCLVPWQVDGTPRTLATLCPLRHPMFQFCFVFVTFVLCYTVLIFINSSSLLSFGLLCGPWPTSWTQHCCFRSLSLYLPSSCLVVRLVFSCRPSVGPSTGHIIGLMVPANSNLVPLGHGLRPERMFAFVSFSLLFLSFLLFSFLIISLFLFILILVFFGCM